MDKKDLTSNNIRNPSSKQASKQADIPAFGYYNMDCIQGMKMFPDKYFDLAIVDPPYGIGMGHTHGVGKSGTNRPFGGTVYGYDKTRKSKQKQYHVFNDDSIPNSEYFDEVFRVSKEQIIWGGNFFLEHLGRATCMIVWDKARRNLDQADCEIAWTSLNGQPRVFNFRWNGMLQENMKNKEIRIHPTQKPIALYEWLLNRFAKPDDIILDTHVGSASSLIACHRTHHKFVGFEIDPVYYKESKERLGAEMSQMTIFDFMSSGDKEK